MTSAAATFRHLHHRARPLVTPNPWDVGSAVLLQALGFEALATTSSGLAFAAGRVDGALTREQALTASAAMCAATIVPVSADLEDGYGAEPEAVAETVTRAVEVGLAGCSIEDFTGRPEAPIHPESLAVERIAAAVEAARASDADFVLTARSECLLWTEAHHDDAIARLQAYEAAGADVLFAPGLATIDAIAQTCAELTRPVSVGLEMAHPPTIAELGEAGVARVSVGARFVRQAYGALVEEARQLRDHGTLTTGDDIIDYDELEAMFGMDATD